MFSAKKQRKPFFLDTWVLSDYGAPDKAQALASYIAARDYLPVINSLSLIELFNPGWKGAAGAERGQLTASLIADLACGIVYPRELIRAEFRSYPQPVPSLPIQLDLSEIGAHVRAEALLRFLRADPLFLVQDKDVRKWSASYARLKSEWSDSRHTILAGAVDQGLLLFDGDNYSFAKPSAREDFLCSLDRRLFGFLSREEWEGLGANLVELFLGATRDLPGVRLSSLLFVHTYVEVPSSARRRAAGSDLRDLWHLSVASYCAAITADASMKRVLERLRPEAKLQCEILNPSDLRLALS